MKRTERTFQILPNGSNICQLWRNSKLTSENYGFAKNSLYQNLKLLFKKNKLQNKKNQSKQRKNNNQRKKNKQKKKKNQRKKNSQKKKPNNNNKKKILSNKKRKPIHLIPYQNHHSTWMISKDKFAILLIN